MYTSIRTQNQQTKSKQAATIGRQGRGGCGSRAQIYYWEVEPPVVEGVDVCHRSWMGSLHAASWGKGWPHAAGRWSEDLMREQGEAAQKYPSNHPTSQQRHRNMFSGKGRHINMF
jgi:hypothetical protein